MSLRSLAAILVVAFVPMCSVSRAATFWLAPGMIACAQLTPTGTEGPVKPANPPAGADATANDAKALQELLERIKKLEGEVERLKNGAAGQPKAAGGSGNVMALVDLAHLGMVYQATGQSRYVALHMIVVNTSDKPVTLKQGEISAEIDGENRKLETIPQDIAAQSFQHKNQSYRLQQMQPEKARTVPAGSQISFWLVFPSLPVANSIPKCKLNLPLGDVKKQIDVNAVQRAMLALESERIGPRSCLALITITGTMTMFNTQALVDELEQLVAQKIARVVVKWSSEAPQPEGQILMWLQNSAATLGNVRNPNELFPGIPGSLREFHLVKYSDKDANNQGFAQRPNLGPNRIHADASEAVGAALKTAFSALPRDELLQEIREGHTLTRAAALAYGGARLDAEHLPLIFQWVEDKDPEIQRAALQTLSHFGEREAIDKLVYYVKKNVEPLSSTAIESLAGSRFGAAHEALLELLKNEPPESRKLIFRVLAKYPRPAWSDTLYEFVSDSGAEMNQDAVKALVQVGHPKLVEILEHGLKSTDKSLRDFCFQTLAGRTDERSENLALTFALAQLKDAPPDAMTTQLLIRTKDARAMPLLLEQLERTNNDRGSVINLLIQIGDQTIAEKLFEKYPSLSNGEKAAVLNGLKQFKHPKFRELAGAALLTNDSSLVSMAANTLMQEGHPEGEKLLIAALDKQTTAHLLHNITNALGNYGTANAKAALLKAKESKDPNKRNYATNALMQLRHRSPGFQYVIQGQQRMQSPVDPADKDAKKQQEKDAIEFFELAMQLDPQIAEAFAGRGKVYLRQEKMAEAGKDFEKALELELEPEDSEVVTGLALARVTEGKIDDALKLIEAGREKHKNVRAGLYLYNSACVYSRSVEYLSEHKDLPDADKKSVEYRNKALADLEQSIKQGFVDFEWMGKDPDFKALRDDAEFKKLVSSKPAATGQPKTEAE